MVVLRAGIISERIGRGEAIVARLQPGHKRMSRTEGGKAEIGTQPRLDGHRLKSGEPRQSRP